MFDDFWIDQDGGVAYLTTHRQNTVDRLALEPSQNGNNILSMAGDPFNDELIGPTAGHWGPLRTGICWPLVGEVILTRCSLV